MYLTHFPDESAAIRICHADTVMFFLRSIVDQLVVLSNGNSSVEIIGTILSRETDEREDMDIEERMRADGRVNLDKPIQTPSPIFYAPLQCLKRVESHSVIYAAVEQRHSLPRPTLSPSLCNRASCFTMVPWNCLQLRLARPSLLAQQTSLRLYSTRRAAELKPSLCYIATANTGSGFVVTAEWAFVDGCLARGTMTEISSTRKRQASSFSNSQRGSDAKDNNIQAEENSKRGRSVTVHACDAISVEIAVNNEAFYQTELEQP
ncbi:hypothetical protein BLNAU_23791 [Blattamonas nauphoetae]|uniref:Uncharacterized protein n=1 Tax=Blattamonas nauphoetae TaxID=2049346 RepID=A0ABQ9WP86_9EUKA|nr:hypothetical protein BLNAU_23791 [Blattamonas nauphoetae]